MNTPAPVHVVVSGRGVEQVFADRSDAEAFAAECPDARVSRHPVRRSMADAVVVFDRRVVVAQGATVLDSSHVVHQFVDDPRHAPDPVDVEWFHDPARATWHIAGFGVDKVALDAEVEQAVDRFSRLGHDAATEVAAGVLSP